MLKIKINNNNNFITIIFGIGMYKINRIYLLYESEWPFNKYTNVNCVTIMRDLKG